MSGRIGIRSVGIIAISSAWVLAAIPEPDAVLYGPALVNGVPAQQQSAVVLVARLNTAKEIGRFDFADCNADGVRDACELSCSVPGCSGVAGCGTARDTSPADGKLDDCPGDLYALKIRCESTPDGIPASGNAAVFNPNNPEVVNIFMAVAGGPEKFVRSLVINERGKIRNLAASVLNLFAYRDFQLCLEGPAARSPSANCAGDFFSAADHDDDGDADLRDFAAIQNRYAGS